MANKIEVIVSTDDATDYSAIEAKAAEGGAATGAAFEAGASAPMLSLADRMRAGYDAAFSDMESGTRAFTDAQLGTFRDYYSGLSEQGDKSAADMLARVRSLSGDAESAAEDVANSVSTTVSAGFQDAGVAGGNIFSRAFVDTSTPALTTAAHDTGSAFTATFSKSVQDSLGSATVSGILGSDQTFKTLGEQAGEDFATGFVAQSGGGSDSGGSKKTGGSGSGGGKESGGGDGMGGIMVGAMVAGAAEGAPLILAALGPVMTGITGLALKSNQVIAADYKTTGTLIANTFTQAAAPLAGTFHQALVGVDSDIKGLGPGLQQMFTNAEPDITAVASGLEGFTSNVLPGMSSAIGGSQVIVSDFSKALPGLGSSVGDFFTGLDTDATTTGAGLQSVFGVIGNSVSTLGHVMGSASSAISTDLLAIDPAINTVLTTVRQLSNPATIGAGAGLFAAFKLDPSISSGLGSLSSGMLSLAEKTEGASGITDKFSGAALKSAGALNSAAGVMSGPWGMAIGAGVGLLSGLVGSLLSASHASDALSLSQEGLQKAIAQDGGQSGAATAQFVAQSAVQDGLAASAAKAGVSLATWTSAVTGNKAAQQDVTAAVDKLNASQLQQAQTTQAGAAVTGKASGDLAQARVVSLAQADATDTLTDSNKKLLGSMGLESSQIASTISTQRDLNAATITLNSNTQIFNATLDAARTAAQLQYQTTAQSSVALLGLGDDQSTLNMQLVNSESAYATASGAAGAYNTVLTSLNGTQMSMDQAQNTLAQDMLNAKTSFKANGDSLSLNTQAGINNRQALTQAATAIQALGIANIQSGGNLNTANAIIQQQAAAFVKATGATGQAKTAIEQYLSQLDQIPPNMNTNVTVSTANAQQKLQQLINQFQQIENFGGNPTNGGGGRQLSQYGLATGGITGAAATGGARSSWTQINEQGQEAALLPTGTIVLPHSNTESMFGGNSQQPGGGTATAVVTFAGATDGAFATAFMRLVRENKIQIKVGR